MNGGEAAATNSLLRKSSLYSVASIAPVLSTLLITPALTRSVPVSEYGVIASSLVIVQIVAMLAALGLPTAITRVVILTNGGEATGRGLILAGAVAALLFGFVLALTSVWWWEMVAPFAWRPSVIAVGISGCTTAIVLEAQAYFRGRDYVFKFIVVAAAVTLLGQGIGTLICLFYAKADGYLWGQAAAYLCVAITCALCSLDGPARLNRNELKDALKIGVPTIPHQVSLYLASTALVLIVGHRLSLADAGRMQLVLLVGTGPSLILNAVNNAWAPSVYRTPESKRGEWLAASTKAVSWGTTFLTTILCLIAPLIVRVVAPAQYSSDKGLEIGILIVATSAIGVVGYLANVHLIFVSGRTWALILISPVSLAVSAGVAYSLSGLGSVSAVAVAAPAYSLVQALLTAAFARKISPTRWRWSVMCGPAACTLVVVGICSVLPEGLTFTIVRLLAALSMASITSAIFLFRYRSRKTRTVHDAQASSDSSEGLSRPQ